MAASLALNVSLLITLDVLRSLLQLWRKRGKSF